MKFVHAASLTALLAFTTTLSTRAVEPPPPPSINVEFLGLKAEAKSIVFVVQHSGSCLDSFDDTRTAIARSLRPLTSNQSVTVIAVSESAEFVAGNPAPATRERKKNIAAALGNMRAQGMLANQAEPWLDAFKKVAACKPDAVFLLTTGSIPQPAADAMQKAMLTAKSPLYVVGLNLDIPGHNADTEKQRLHDVEQLKNLVANTGGSFITVSEKDFKASFNKPLADEPPDLPANRKTTDDGELFPDVSGGTTAQPKMRTVPAAPVSKVTPPAVAAKPVPPRPVVAASQPATHTFVATHRVTLVTNRVLEGIPTQTGNKVTVRLELGSVDFDEKQILKIEPIKN